MDKSGIPDFLHDLQDGKLCEQRLFEHLRSLGCNPQVNVRRPYPTPQIMTSKSHFPAQELKSLLSASETNPRSPSKRKLEGDRRWKVLGWRVFRLDDVDSGGGAYYFMCSILTLVLFFKNRILLNER